MKRKPLSLPAQDLRYTCPVGAIPWKTTKDAPLLKAAVGQQRALRAIDFGLGMECTGYNLFLMGEPGCGKASTVTSLVTERASQEPVPSDWAYVHNFGNPRSPTAISFPAGRGRLFVRQMKELVEFFKKGIARALEDKEFEERRSEIITRMARENAEQMERFTTEASQAGFAFEKTDDEFSFIPMADGKRLSEEEFNALPPEQKRRYEEGIHALRERFKAATRSVRKHEEEIRSRIDALTREHLRNTVAPLLASVASAHPDNDRVKAWLDDLLEDVLENYGELVGASTERFLMPGVKITVAEPTLTRYEVNLIVDMAGQKGAPVVTERNPTFYNLIGKMEHTVQFGMASTNFTHIQAGALHLANGGYLVLDALEVLRSPFAWEALKNSIKSASVRIEDLGEQYRLFSTASLKPEPIPLDVKVVLLGTPFVYYLLLSYDLDFSKLFKVKADFGSSMHRTDEAVKEYALFVASTCRRDNLLPFDAGAAAAIVEFGARLAGDKERLTTRFSEVANLVRESSYWAGRDGAKLVTRDHVRRADAERRHRHDRIEERMGELIEEGTIQVQTAGGVVGQVNGISYYDQIDYGFAKPTRLTAKVFPGKSGTVNIEREVKLSGSIHSKGVLIAASYLAMRYARDFPLSLGASVTFEQTYEEVEGDSATAAEVVALASALSEVPVRQDLAITGSMDQHGNIQPVGGINEKIEGFFATCAARGLTGDEGVVIPRANVRNLMLSPEVVQAVRDGKFTVYAVRTADEAIELLTGQMAGERGEDGAFPAGSVNAKVEDRLHDMADLMRYYEEPLTDEGPAQHPENEEEQEEEKS